LIRAKGFLIMKLTTLALAAAFAVSGSAAFAQAGEGDSNYEGHWTGDGYGAGYSPGYGSGYVPYVRSYAYAPDVRVPRLATPAPRHRSRAYNYDH
jgi:hypothetical protein